MKTEATVQRATEQDDPLETILQRPVRVSVEQTSSEAGIRLGTLRGFDHRGHALVHIDGLTQQVCATLVALREQDIGRRVALGFIDSEEPQQPIILGLLLETPAVQISSPQSVDIVQHNGCTTIRAEEKLELRCGKAVIELRADGHIQLHGIHITSHARAGQRIRGGSVQIN